MVVLGISANSRVIGLAIIQKNLLIDYKIHLYKQRWSDIKAQRMISSLHSCIKEYTINSVALTIPPAHYTTRETKALIAKIKIHCRKKKIRLTTYHPKAFDSLYETSKTKKRALMKAMVTRYPELETSRKKELRNKNKYYHKLFEAVGAGTLLAGEHY